MKWRVAIRDAPGSPTHWQSEPQMENGADFFHGRQRPGPKTILSSDLLQLVAPVRYRRDRGPPRCIGAGVDGAPPWLLGRSPIGAPGERRGPLRRSRDGRRDLESTRSRPGYCGPAMAGGRGAHPSTDPGRPGRERADRSRSTKYFGERVRIRRLRRWLRPSTNSGYAARRSFVSTVFSDIFALKTSNSFPP